MFQAVCSTHGLVRETGNLFPSFIPGAEQFHSALAQCSEALTLTDTETPKLLDMGF